MPKLNLTVKNIDAIIFSPNHTSYYIDRDLQGFRLVVSKHGIKTFQIYMRFNGRPTKRTIGRYPKISPALARTTARKFILLMVQGIDPHAEKTRVKKELTYKDIWLPYFEYLRNKAGLKPKTAERCIKNHLVIYGRYDALHLKKLSFLTTEKLESFHRDYSYRQNKPVMANNIIRQISACYNYSRQKNPAQGIRLNKQPGRTKYLRPEDMPAFLQAIFDDESVDFRDIFLLCLYTASRIGAVMSMEWTEVDLKYGIWSPVTKTSMSEKNKTNIGLVGRAADILRRRHFSAHSRWVFPANTQTGHVSSPYVPFSRVMSRAGLKGYVPHDLRHTAVSWFASVASASNQELLTLMGNKSLSTVGIYTHLNVTVVQDRYNNVVDRIVGSLDPELQKRVNADSI